MDLQKLSLKLHPLERKVLPVLKKETEFNAITKKSGLQEIEVMRALQWLENKEIIGIHTEKKKIVLLDKNGMKYRKEGLPEKAFLTALSDEFKGLNVITKKSKLSREEVNACIGLLKRKVAIDVKKEDILNVKITEQGKKLRTEPSFEEQFLAKEFPIDLLSIQDLDKLAFDELKKRKDFLKIEEQKTVTVTLTEIGQKLLTTNLTRDVINRLTPAMLKTGSWRNKEFRAYDIEINVPTTHQGKKHFVTEAVEYITQIWLDMGFKEMSGQYVQSAFWDLDALFVPQDHPAREMQDTFYVEGEASLPPVWKKVKAVHENGGDTGSTGWKYTFSEDETKKILLRTHTTVLSAQTIANLTKDDLPAKFFSVGKVFRNEALDWKHLFEFYQVEGIVIDPNANLKHLKGYLTQFYKKMGFDKVRMRPAHFPYTEPSLEVDVFHPVKKEWVELGGAGIFRPEVVKPLLGFDCPVLAWGQGMGRIISEYWNITDIRDLYRNDLKQIREMKSWLK
ncbi:phenylalanine--tRNA ligase subunit alpha [Candidatus Woesearchaeota archaeon]|jgi:phenylalanyl-tRNA synthetase alpha chain|nr:phenylalanine--tRNA ligase subunit alpha [Candidatus Woesearchaeota archaeon]MBT5397309.1 phenylalanine--tRNA ligase subunit alpha [Candidatus Woesearchaeota archaeon]MBT6367846.1 phenylalanine--tRNA ligase subunit alpha [Candidatus Woesearchaeota archaeon]MBT7762709.1 phenylalanine--tRNA ligase subunit alpha [Candidatus Woesearchaeota archaeon]